MKIGFVGLGKLGLPVALAVEKKGHSVYGYDLNKNVKTYLEKKEIPYKEVHVPDFIQNNEINFTDLDTVTRNSDIIFMAVQTPHEALYEGTTRIPESRADFDYSMLRQAAKSVSDSVDKQSGRKIVVIISTVLPGTIQEQIQPLLSDKIDLVYNPFFIAMGNTINDFYYPEFVLLGTDAETQIADHVKSFYKTIHDAPVYHTTIKNAEFIKVAYNTFIGMKIAYANTIMEICHKIGADCDGVIDGISMANQRLISSKYLRGGMGDGGGCHPRDNIAMSWLAKKLNLSHDFFEDIMMARENQTKWLAELCVEHDMPICILGKSFKPETNIVTGSPAVLLANLLNEIGKKPVHIDPHVNENFDSEFNKITNSHVFFIGTQHDAFKSLVFPSNSVVIDPFRYMPKNQKDVKYISIGKL